MASKSQATPAAAPAAKPAAKKKTAPAAAPAAPKAAAWFSNPEFLISDAGIFERQGKAKTLNRIHQFAIMPIETLGSIEGDGEIHVHVKVQFQTSTGKVENRTIPQGELTSFGAQGALAKAGWPLPPTSQRSKVASAMLGVLKAGVPTREGYAGAGWVIPEKVHIRPGHELYTGATSALTEKAGTREAWAATVCDMLADSPACALAVAAAFGSYLRGLVKLPANLSHIFQLYGEHRRGKSTILAVVASIQGKPSKGTGSPLFDSSTTNVGYEFLLTASNHGFLAIDEIDEILRRDGGTNRLMYLTNGGGRAKGDAFGGLHMGKTWDATMITAGNAAISSLNRGDMKEGALNTRVFELDILDADIRTFSDRQAASRYLPALIDNHGHGYEAAIAALVARPDYWRDIYNESFDELTNDTALRHFDEERRFAIFVALAQAGAELAGEVLGEAAAEDCRDAVSRLIDRYRRDDEDTMESADREALTKIESFKQFIADNAGRFRWEGFAWNEDKLTQERQAKDLSNYATTAGALGVIAQRRIMEHPTDFDGEAMLNPKGEEVMAKSAHLSSIDFAHAARRFGLLKTQGDGRDRVKIKGKVAELVGASRVLRIELREVELAPAAAGAAKTKAPDLAALSELVKATAERVIIDGGPDLLLDMLGTDRPPADLEEPHPFGED